MCGVSAGANNWFKECMEIKYDEGYINCVISKMNNN